MSRRKWNRVIAVAMAVMMMVSMLLPMSGTAGRGDNYEAEATSAISPGSRYTVDFAYEGYEFSMGGNQSILLSELFLRLNINESVSEVSGVSFTDEMLICVEQGEGDWKLKSLAPFSSNELLTITMNDGSEYSIKVTDAVISTNLNQFINSVLIEASTDENGVYIVMPDVPYNITFSFMENSSVQFPNDNSEMTYTIPAKVKTDDQSGTFSIKVNDGGTFYTVSGNTYSIHDNILKVGLNTTDPNFSRLSASALAQFSFTVTGVFDETLTDVNDLNFENEIIKQVKIDVSNSVEVSKSATLNTANDKIEYTVAVKSTGKSKNVVVSDTLSGSTAVTLDTSSINATSSTGAAVSMSGSASGNGFTYTIGEMKNNEIVTFNYSANIDPAAITPSAGKYVTSSGNSVSVKSDGDTTPDTASSNTNIDYTPSISKGNASVGADGKTLTWTVVANDNPKVSMAGSVLTDTIGATSQDIMKYSGTGLNIEVYDASGNNVRTDNVNWNDLTSKSDSSWSYTIPSGDNSKNYKYVITYTTEVDTTGKTSQVSVGNTVTTSGGKTSIGSGTVAPVGGEVNVYKTLDNVDLENKVITWKVSFNVPKEGLDKAVITDQHPNIWINNEHIFEKVTDVSIDTSLLDGETYTVNTTDENTIITFYKNNSKTEPGLKESTSGRNIVLTLKTEINDIWFKSGKTDAGHTQRFNNVTLDVGSSVKNASQTATVAAPSVTKKVEKTTSKSTDLPIYKYSVILENVSSDINVVEDSFDTELFEVCFPDDVFGAGYVFGGGIWSQDNLGGRYSYVYTADGVRMTTSAECMPHDTGSVTGFYDKYKLVYCLKVKDQTALNKLNQKAAESENGKYQITNNAKWNGISVVNKYPYQYDALSKEILTSDSELKKTEEDIWADFRIVVNPAGIMMNGGAPMVMTDDIVNLSIDMTSITAVPSKDVVWDMSGNTLTLTIPDGEKVVIEYRARVILDEEVPKGGTKTIAFSNTALIKANDVQYEKSVNKSAEFKNEGNGSAPIPVIKLMKYEAGNMTKRLSGAVFQLLDANKDPILDKDGKEVTFVTDSNGMIEVRGNQELYGWVLYTDLTYYLREIKAPEGYKLASFDYEFTVSNDSTTDYSKYIYHTGDTMSAKNYRGADVKVSKEWSNGALKHETDSVTVKLQQKIGDGEYSDTIRRLDGDEWKDVSGTTTVVLNKANGWSKTFTDLPATVPPALPDDGITNYVDAHYRVVEIKINEDDVDQSKVTYEPASAGYDTQVGGTFEYKITNEVENPTGSFKISKAVTENGKAISSAAIKKMLAGDYTFNVYTNEECTTAYQKVAGTDLQIVLTVAEDGATVTSDEVTGVPEGDYWIKETVPSNGSTPITNPIKITVDKNKTGDNSPIASFVNNINTGKLTVSKTVVSDAAADKAKVFSFTIELSDKTINGAFDGVVFANGVATVEFKDGESASITGIPTGISYKVTETADTDFITTKSGDTGTINSEESKAVFTNSRKTGDLSVSKTVESNTASDKTKDFSFTVTLSDTSISGTYGDMTFANGVATITLKDGDTKTATGLPTGITYTVTEAAKVGFSTTKTGDTGTITTTASSASFTNTRLENGFNVTKTVVSPIEADKSTEFEFTITLKDTSVSGTYGGVTFTSGVATFKLKNGESKAVTGLPYGTEYTVTEAANDLFTTEKNGDSGKVGTAALPDAAFTNTRKTGKLTVNKTVASDLAADADKEFSFEIVLSDNTLTGDYGDVTFTSGVASFKLKGGESKTATDIPTGITYTVTETEAAGFVTTKSGETGTISTSEPTAAFTNTRETGNLSVEKGVVSSTAADKNKNFSFTVTLSDTSISKTYGEMTFENGVATFVLKDGEKKTATGLPTDVNYTVTEEAVDGFVTTKTGDAGKISKDTSEAKFTNTRDEGGIIVSKRVTSDLAADKLKAFTFTVSLDDTTINGDYGVEFTDGVATFNLKDGESKSITGLPKGIKYTVAETVDSDFDVTKTGETGTISDTASAAEFTNTRKTGKLTVSKTVVSDAAADKDKVFSFTIELSDKTLNGTFGGVTFTDGVVTFGLKDGEQKEATGIPTGITFKVAEVAVDGFVTSMLGQEGTIDTTSSTAAFTNTRDKGELSVSKAVVSSTAADMDKNFSFTVTLSDNSISGEYGEMIFSAGVATFTLKSGETKDATDLPTGITYTVTEMDADGFVNTAKSGDTGTISKTKSEAAFTNTRDEGGLIISKIVESPLAADETEEFKFTVTLDDTTINGTYGDATFTDGVAEFTLKSGELKQITGLPKGIGYTVEEDVDATRYTLEKTNYSGSISGTASLAAFTNKRITGGLTVKKAVVSDKAEDSTKEFDFTVTLDNNTISGNFGEATFTSGVASFKLKKDESVSITGLPVGIKYTVAETADDDFTTTYSGNTGTISNGVSTAEYTNTRKPEGPKVKISKTDIANGEEIEGATIQILDEVGNVVVIEGAKLEWVSGKTAKEIEGLKTGVTYTLRETVAPDGYAIATDTTFVLKADGTIDTANTTTKVSGEGVLLIEDTMTFVKISKVDINSKEELEGATIQILDAEGKVVEISGTKLEWVSGKTAKEIKGLKTGVIYTLHEKAAPDKYDVAEDTQFVLKADGTIDTDKTTSTISGGILLVEDKPVGPSVKISKVDTGAGTEVAGAHIQILDKDNKVVDEWDSELTAHVSNKVKAGETYTLRETVAPDGYTVTTDTTFTLDANGNIDKTKTTTKVSDEGVLLVEDTKASVKISKTDVASGEELEGATIQILDTEGNVVEIGGEKLEWVSGTTAKEIVGLKTGIKYILRETVAPEGYTIVTDTYFELNADGTINTSRTTTPINADGVLLVEDTKTSVKISKTDIANGEELEGAKIQILDADGKVVVIGGTKLEWVSGKEAKEIEGLKTGVTYTLRETVAPDGYAIATDTTFALKADGTIDTTKTTTKVSDTGVLLIEDTMTSVKISKVDINSKEELEGATIQILDETGNVVEIGGTKLEWVSGKTAKEIKGLKTGVTYTLHEKAAPDKYDVAEDTQFVLKADGTIDTDKTTSTISGGIILVEDKPVGPSVKISKVDTGAGTEVAGAHIQILDKDNKVVDEWDSELTAHVSDKVKAGETYTLRETVAPDGYAVTTDTTFTLDANGEIDKTRTTTKVSDDGVLLVEDAKTSVKISKTDIANGEELEGATIQILDETGNVVEIGDEKLEWVSGKEAKEIVGLKTGVTYTLRETVAPKGYQLTTDTIFTLDEYGNVITDDESKTTTRITNEGVLLVEDKPEEKPEVPEVPEVPETPKSVSISKVDVTTQKEIEGATIRILDDKGNIVDEWVSGKTPHVVTGLSSGVTYTLREITPPEGYYLTTDTIFTLDQDGKVIGDTSKTTTTVSKEGVLLVEDAPIPVKGMVIINKKGYVNESCSGSPEETKPLKGVTFTLSRTELKAGEKAVSLTAVTDDNGVATFTDLEPGLYEVRETATLTEYVLDTNTYYVRINEDGSSSGLMDSAEKAVGGNIIINEPLREDFVFVKVSEADHDKTLPGSTYGLYEVMEDGTRVLITTDISDENGEVVFEGLLPGKKYEVEELAAPDGYYVSNNPVSFGYTITVDEDGEKKIEIDPALLEDGNRTVYFDEAGVMRWLEPSVIVSFSKVDGDGIMLSGATLRIEDMNGNVIIPEWVSNGMPYIAEGVLVIGNTYKLVEIKAPEGYALAEPVVFTVPDEEVKPDENKIITLSMTDVKIPEVVPPDTSIQTGDDTPVLPYALFTMFGFVGIVSTISVKVKDRKKAKAENK